MARWRAFVDVLDELLIDRRRESVEEFVARRTRTTARPAATTPVTFAAPPLPNRFWSRPGPYRDAVVTPPTASSQPQVHQPQTRGQVPPSAPAEKRPARRLRPAELHALQTLVRLGASLDRSFTARELRSAFRALAQRYHPDRHPGADEAERLRLGAAFTELTIAYGVLSDATQ